MSVYRTIGPLVIIVIALRGMKRQRNSVACNFWDGSHETLFQGDTSDVVPYAACFVSVSLLYSPSHRSITWSYEY